MDDPRLEKLGKKIKRLRIEKGYSNYEHFAYKVGISRSQYGKYETGHNLTFLTLLKIVDGLDMTLKEFFEDGLE